MLNTFDQINKLSLNSEKPLLIFDADEVLVLFASHFSKYLIKNGWNLNLRSYQLDDAIVHIEDGHIADKITYQKLIDAFINQETATQPEATGASEILKKFEDRAEIVILTNVPNSAYDQRIENLSNLKMAYPTISNSGMKGPALMKLKELTSKTCIFVDDNPYQIASAAECVPDIYRFHFTACDIVKKTMPYADGATHRPSSWKEIGVLIDQLLS